MGRLDGKVVFITGAARGQGRSHAVRMAQEGADIIAVDICAPVAANIAPPATEADLAETVRLVEDLDRRIVASKVDVRDFAGLKAAVTDGVTQLGHLDIVVANAGVWTYGLAHELTEDVWSETIDIVLSGVWQTLRATVPTLIAQGIGGSIVITSSAMAIKVAPHMGHYAAAKHGLTGLMKTSALELAPHSIRVNTVNPGGVNTDLVHNKPTYDLFMPDAPEGTKDMFAERMATLTALPTPWVEPIDVSNAVLFLASEEARFITGITLVVDAGGSIL